MKFPKSYYVPYNIRIKHNVPQVYMEKSYSIQTVRPEHKKLEQEQNLNNSIIFKLHDGHKTKILDEIFDRRTCRYCGERFTSRNKLFEHLRSNGIQTNLPIMQLPDYIAMREKRLRYLENRKINKMVEKMISLKI